MERSDRRRVLSGPAEAGLELAAGLEPVVAVGPLGPAAFEPDLVGADGDLLLGDGERPDAVRRRGRRPAARPRWRWGRRRRLRGPRRGCVQRLLLRRNLLAHDP